MHFFNRFLIVASLVIILSNVVSGQNYSIMPLGNSITQGDNAHFSYRYMLWKKLIEDGVSFDFVGSMTEHYNCGAPVFPDYNGQSFDMDHEGHWGWRCDQIINGGPSSNCAGPGNLSSWLNNYTPDIVLLHGGTNDLYQGQSVSSTLTEIESIIGILRADNPNVAILLATVIPTTINNLQIKIILLNAEIPNIAVSMADPNSPIIIVDQFAGFDPILDTQGDGVHPNESGEEKMAQKWRDAIQSVIVSPTGLHLDLKVFLGGAYLNGGVQRVNPGLTAGFQPFNQPPWIYAGIEELFEIGPDIVDWVLVELRDAGIPEQANESSIISTQACLLNVNGQVLDVQGLSDLYFNVSVTQNLYVVIHQLNHLPVMSGAAIAENAGIYSYDFSSSIGQAYGGSQAMRDLGDGFYGMISGDYNMDGIIDDLDKSLGWEPNAGNSGYLNADLNLDGTVNNLDKNEYHILNLNKVSFVPQ